MALRAMQHDEGRTLLREARASRAAQAKQGDFTKFTKDQSRVLGLLG